MKRYLAHPLLAVFFSVLDVFFRSPQKEVRLPISRILLSNIAHLGDVIIATSVLPAIKKRYPDAKIGFLTSSASAHVLQNHPDISWIHTFDHFKLNRTPLPLWKKLLIHFQTARKARGEIEQNSYEVALDLYMHFPNAALLLHRARIPHRLGYASGGWGFLFTQALHFKDLERPLPLYYEKHLDALHIREKTLKITLPRSSLTPPFAHYILFHMGASDPLKELSPRFWKALASLFQHHRVLFTGQGERERRNIEEVCISPLHLNLCGSSWQELVSIVQSADLVITVDTSLGHLSAAFDIPTLSLFTPFSSVPHWKPFHPKNISLLVSCACRMCKKEKKLPCTCATLAKEVALRATIFFRNS